MNKRKDVVPNNLKEYRLKGGFTQKQVADGLSLTNSQDRISEWEQGIRIPSVPNLFKLCGLYKTTPFDLYPQLVTSVKHIGSDIIKA